MNILKNLSQFEKKNVGRSLGEGILGLRGIIRDLLLPLSSPKLPNHYFLNLAHNHPDPEPEEIFFQNNATVYWLYGTGTKYWGSTQLRVFQHAPFIRQKGFDIKVGPTHKFRGLSIDPSIVVLSKTALQSLGVKQLKEIRSSGHYIVGDLIDGLFSPEILGELDEIWMSNFVAMETMKFDNKFFLPHAVDRRLTLLEPMVKKATVVYWGLPKNTNPPVECPLEFQLEPTNDRFSVRRPLGVPKAVRSSLYHWTVRKSQKYDGVKPATKIYTACWLGAFPIVDENDFEAKRLLGVNYPLIIKDSLLPEGVSQRTTAKYMDEASRHRKSFMSKAVGESCPICVDNRMMQRIKIAHSSLGYKS